MQRQESPGQLFQRANSYFCSGLCDIIVQQLKYKYIAGKKHASCLCLWLILGISAAYLTQVAESENQKSLWLIIFATSWCTIFNMHNLILNTWSTEVRVHVFSPLYEAHLLKVFMKLHGHVTKTTYIIWLVLTGIFHTVEVKLYFSLSGDVHWLNNVIRIKQLEALVVKYIFF